MAEIQLNRQAAANGQLPNVCLCCGAPATQTVQHRFYLRSTGILIAMLLLGKMRWLFLPQSYEYSELRVPLCGFHRHRLNLHWYLLVGFAVLGLLCVPVLLLGSINRDYLWVTEIGLVAFLLLFPVMFITVLTVMILTPRLVEHSNMSVKLVSVSTGFAQALGSAGMPGMMPGLQPAAGYGMPAKMPGLSPLPTASGGGMFDGFNLQLGLITAGACALSLLEVGIIYFGNSLIAGSVNRLGPGSTRPVLVSNDLGRREADRRQREWEAQVRRQMEESQRRMEELNRRSQTQPVNPPSFRPNPAPPPSSTPTPSTDPDHWDNVRRWTAKYAGETARGRLIARDGDWITIVYKRGSSTELLERKLFLRSLIAEDQAFVLAQFPDPPTTANTPLTTSKLLPTNENNKKFIPPANGIKPGHEVTNSNQVKTGDKIHIFWAGAWYPGLVMGTQEGLIKVHFDNHDEFWDELATPQRVRSVNAVASAPASPTSPPSPPAVTPPVTPPAPPPAAPPAEMRTWTDATGRFKLEAKLIALEGMDVKLERPDGKIVTMRLDQLSAADQVVVRAKYP